MYDVYYIKIKAIPSSHCIFWLKCCIATGKMVEVAYTPRYCLYGIYQPRKFVAQSINPMYNLYLISLCCTASFHHITVLMMTLFLRNLFVGQAHTGGDLAGPSCSTLTSNWESSNEYLLSTCSSDASKLNLKNRGQIKHEMGLA